MDSNNILNLQHQIKDNSEELQKYLHDLESWEKEMRKKEEELKLIQTTPEDEIPPIRNSLYRSKKKNRHKKQKEKMSTSEESFISATDYQAWEKFDAEAELKEIEEETKQSSESENSENEDEFVVQKRKQLALLHKDKGNSFFKTGNYDSAINSYTSGLQLDPENPLLAANRAMAFLKKGQFQAAENDCTLCLSIDPTYVKAYLRRGTARKNLQKFSLAKADFSKALELEPENKQAQAELEKLSKGSDIKITELNCSRGMNSVKRSMQGVKESSSCETSPLEEEFKYDVPEPSLPSVPTACFQFLTDWNEIASYPDLRYQYLKQFPPEKLPVFFKHYMEPAIFPKILETLSSSFIEHGDDVFDYMKYLSEIGRFSTMVMFLSGKEENDLKKLLEYLKTSGRPESEISDVLKKYGA